MDITKLTDSDLSYMEGFVAKCAELGIDPELALKQACGKGCKAPCASVKKGGKSKVPVFKKKAQDAGEVEQPPKKGVIGGAAKGGLAGAGIGAALGGAGAAGLLGAAGGMPKSRNELVLALKAIAAGALGGAAAGGASGAVTGGALRAAQ